MSCASAFLVPRSVVCRVGLVLLLLLPSGRFFVLGLLPAGFLPSFDFSLFVSFFMVPCFVSFAVSPFAFFLFPWYVAVPVEESF